MKTKTWTVDVKYIYTNFMFNNAEKIKYTQNYITFHQQGSHSSSSSLRGNNIIIPFNNILHITITENG